MKSMDRLIARLRAIPGYCTEAGAEAALESAEEARDMAASLAPVDTGRLRGSIAVSAMENGAAVSADCDYAACVELGTRRAAARPYLYPAAQAQAGAFPARAAQHFRERMGGG